MEPTETFLKQWQHITYIQVPEFLEILKPMKTEKEMTNLIFDVIKEDPAKFKEDFLKLRGKLSPQGRKRTMNEGASTSGNTKDEPSVPIKRKIPARNEKIEIAKNLFPETENSIEQIGNLSHNPFSRWNIKGKVVAKDPIKWYTNTSGKGKYFAVRFSDDSGEIRCTAFNEDVDRLYHNLQLHESYILTNCRVKEANKKFTNDKFEILFSVKSEVIPCQDDL